MESAAESNPLKESLQKFSAATNSNCLCLILGESPIARGIVKQIYHITNSFSPSEPLSLILQSYGGDIDAAYQIVNILRGKCSSLTIYVPRFAKSAASFFCLSADEVVMHATAELGPLDAQIAIDPSRKKFMAALDGFKTMEYLRLYSIDTFDRLMKLVINRVPDIELETAFTCAAQALSAIVKPLFDQVDPMRLGEFNRSLTVAADYGRRVMRKNYFSKLPEDEREDVLNQLIRGYSSHSYVIDFEEAKSIGFNVRLPNPDSESNLMDLYLEVVTETDIDVIDHVSLKETSQAAGQSDKIKSIGKKGSESP